MRILKNFHIVPPFFFASIPLKVSTSHPQHPDHAPSVLNPPSQPSSLLDPLTGSGSHLISPSLFVLMSCAPHFFAFYRDHLQLAQARHFYCWTRWRQRQRKRHRLPVPWLRGLKYQLSKRWSRRVGMNWSRLCEGPFR